MIKRIIPEEALPGSLTVEAALIVSLFFFAVIALALPLEMLDISREVRMEMEARARDICRDAGLFREEGKELPAEGVQEALLYAGIRYAAGDRITGLDVLDTRISSDGEVIDLRASYTLKLPFGLFPAAGIRLSARSLHRGFTGASGSGEGNAREGEEEEMVYVGRDSTRYHRSASCHYLSNAIRSAPAGAAGTLENDSGRRYKACAFCGRSPSGQIYVLPEGERYHFRPDCPSLNYYIRKVPLREAEHLGPCSYCSGGGT